jgi:hypothetical protein
VGEVYDMTGKQVLRPFYPGGDYENAVSFSYFVFEHEKNKRTNRLKSFNHTKL